jgi:GNAT superfamily N-acetyltransferase
VEIALVPEDLAPGDRGSAAPIASCAVRRVATSADPDFGAAYARLYAEFGPAGGMEMRTVIEERLLWDPARPVGRYALLYEMVVVRRAGEIAALRDHTATVRLAADGRPERDPVIVHLSHALVDPAHRGSGLAQWLRALPLQAARRCAAAAGVPAGAPILVAEMDHPDPSEPEGLQRLRSYERAGFQKIDPAAAPYAQPDFRPPERIAADLPRPLPFGLVVRRVGREGEAEMPAAEVAAVVEAIYSVYAVHVPPAAIDPLRADAAHWTARQRTFRLLPPTS